MTRTENDLRTALRELEQAADQHGAPPTDRILGRTAEVRFERRPDASPRRFPRWLPSAVAVAAVAAAAVTAVTLSTRDSSGPSHRGLPAAGSPLTGSSTSAVASHPVAPATPPTPTVILDDAAYRLDGAPAWTAPAPDEFFYVRTTQATTWTSVSGHQAGDGRSADGTKIWISGCLHGQIVSSGESGSCTLDQVPHYLADAPTDVARWDAYLERMAPGSKAGNAQGKIIVEVLHQDLVAPKAAAALLKYTAECPGLHTITVAPVAGQKLVGVTCTSMTNGSYGLAFDATSHAFVGFVGVTTGGRQSGPAEIIRQTGIVPATGRTP